MIDFPTPFACECFADRIIFYRTKVTCFDDNSCFFMSINNGFIIFIIYQSFLFFVCVGLFGVSG